MFEEDYVEYLVVGGHLPRYCSRFRSAEVSVGAVKAKDGHDMLIVAVEVFRPSLVCCRAQSPL